MTSFRKANLTVGWIIFLISTYVYLSTVEPTVSFWDCGEFIAAAYKMLVGHPPGAPFFLILGRFFSMFAPDPSHVAYSINLISVFSSSFTILFLFWTITHLAKKLIVENGEQLSIAQLLIIIGSGIVGSLSYTFSDTFWFSAVEGEVYALSSLFTAMVFWAILKWETEVDKDPYADRWVILISYFIGLSIGVHLLNLLAIPAIAFVYYFKKFKTTKQGIIKTAAISCVALGFIQFGIIPGIPGWGAKFDLLFVNTFRLPFWSGFFFFCMIIIGLVAWGLYYSYKNDKVIFNKILLCFSFIVLGYTPYAIIVIRSNAEPPMDENDPADPFALVSYLNREQYGDRPLIKGSYYTARVIGQDYGEMKYSKGDKKYEEAGRKLSHVFDPAQVTFFPRCYNSLDNSHVSFYQEWLDLPKGKKPSFADNLYFLFSYQIRHMYLRYFMWNFAGRQNDIQGHGNMQDGNWISGIKFLDEARLGPLDSLPEELRNNKAYNKYYFLPLILGLIGLFYQYNKNKKDAIIVMLLFFFTGIAIVLYLNQTPLQPRERDYAYTGSFYAFTIWIGLGVLALYNMFKEKIPEKVCSIIVTLICLFVPALMASQNWDDHDRSRRYTAHDSAYNYLNSCAPNAVIFTNGDNDTFPLWYIQEVEGVRTDVRVINLSLLSTDWYIDQMKRKAYDSEPVPFSLTKKQYIQGTRDYIPFYDRKIPGYSDIKDVMEFIKSDNPQTKARTQSGELIDYFPTKKVKLKVDIEKVLANGTVAREDSAKIVPYIEWEIPKDGLYKSDMMILDLLAYNNWERPVYFAITVSNSSYMNLQEYFQLEGLAYRLVPIKSTTQGGQVEKVATEIMYDNLMNKFKWGGMNTDIYLDENNLRMTSNFRHNFIRLSESLLAKSDKKRAIEVLDRCLLEIPDRTVPYNIFIVRIIDLYYQAGGPEKAEPVVRRLSDITEEKIKYFLSLKNKNINIFESELRQSLAVIQELNRLAMINKQDSLGSYVRTKIENLKSEYKLQ